MPRIKIHVFVCHQDCVFPFHAANADYYCNHRPPRTSPNWPCLINIVIKSCFTGTETLCEFRSIETSNWLTGPVQMPNNWHLWCQKAENSTLRLYLQHRFVNMHPMKSHEAWLRLCTSSITYLLLTSNHLSPHSRPHAIHPINFFPSPGSERKSWEHKLPLSLEVNLAIRLFSLPKSWYRNNWLFYVHWAGEPHLCAVTILVTMKRLGPVTTCQRLWNPWQGGGLFIDPKWLPRQFFLEAQLIGFLFPAAGLQDPRHFFSFVEETAPGWRGLCTSWVALRKWLSLTSSLCLDSLEI